jgi:hypothetical protein
MSEINDGGPAFPLPPANMPGCVPFDGHTGMSLRDWFAGQALAGLSSKSVFDADDCAHLAWKRADKMMILREKGPQ